MHLCRQLEYLSTSLLIMIYEVIAVGYIGVVFEIASFHALSEIVNQTYKRETKLEIRRPTHKD